MGPALSTTSSVAMSLSGVSALFPHTSSWPLLTFIGGSAIFAVAYPSHPFSQPRNIMLGNVGGLAMGLAATQAATYCGGGHMAVSMLATGTTCAFMCSTRSMHPPAGALAMAVTNNAHLIEPLHALIDVTGCSCFVVSTAYVLNRVQGIRYPL